MATSNPMVPTPTTPGMGYEESLYRGIALAQLRILKQQMQLGGLFIGNRRVRLDNGVDIFCNVSGIHESVRVVLPDTVPAVSTKVADAVTHGFATHPRSSDSVEIFRIGPEPYPNLRGGVKSGGWNETQAYSEQPPIFYPLEDAVKGDTLYPVSQDGVVGVGRYKAMQYGNLYWIGVDGTILSWRGTPNRHARVDYHINIPALSTIDDYTVQNFDTVPQYTCFGQSVYTGGEILAKTPVFPWQRGGDSLDSFSNGWVLGAAYRNNKLVIIAYENRRFAKQFEYQVLVNGAVTRLVYGNSHEEASQYLNAGETLGDYYTLAAGFPIVVYQRGGLVDGWTRLAEFSKPRAGLPWFFSEDGNIATCSNGDRITLTDSTATYSNPPSIVGTREHIFKTGEFNSPTLDSTYSWNYNGPVFSETFEEVVATLQSSSTTTSHREYSEKKAVVDRVRVGSTVNRELGIVMGVNTLGIAPFAESAQVLPLVCNWVWNTPLLISQPYGDQNDPCNQNESLSFTGWSGCGEYVWTAISDTGLTATLSGSHYRFATISTVRAKTTSGTDCECLGSSIVYSRPTASGRSIYTYVTVTLPTGSEVVSESDVMPGGAYRPTAIYQEDVVSQNCGGVIGSCLRWYHTYYSLDNTPSDKPAITNAYIITDGRISTVSITPASIAASVICDYEGGYTCESLHFVDGYTSYDTSGNKTVWFYDSCAYKQDDCGIDGLTPRCLSNGTHVCPNGSYTLNIADQCIYLGELPDEVFDADGNQIELPALGSNQIRMICQLETQVCDPNGELGGQL